MRVRHLQTYLAEHRLLRKGRISSLRTMRVGIDAVFWLRTLSELKEPLADALGGLPTQLPAALDRQVSLFQAHNILPLFFFQGLQPRSHMLFSLQHNLQMDEAWRKLGNNDKQGAYSMFAQATSRITSDLVHYIFHYLRSMSLSSASSSSSSSTSSSSPACEVFQAPYLATAQMAYFASCGLLDAIIGPPSLLLFGIPRVIVSVDWKNEAFEWVELQQLLTAWSTDKEQFVDACLLAGTEYCLTFPYLNLNQFHHGQNKFTFGTAIEFIKQAPLVSYMQHFPSAEMKNDHVDGYCVCKALIHYPVIMQLDGRLGFLHQQGLTPPTLSRSLTNGTSSAAPAGASPLQRLPNDYNRIVGSRLPSAVYVLLAEGFLSRKLPAVLALGEWIDASQPAVDSIDYRELLNDVQDYRARALGLLAMRLPAQFRQRQIHFCRYSCTNSGSFERSTVGGSSSETDDSGCSNGDTAVALPRTDSSVFKCWNITAESVKNELKRQGHEKVDVLFCLKWHAHSRVRDSHPFSTTDYTNPCCH
eukprot:GHVT01099612.1.p1 GENE.GHVT01099612.1~~GHVT01099612.1.p1  ORF type:complete len:530 (+),score=65.44 GHVT01099612.1:879-2468(+)